MPFFMRFLLFRFHASERVEDREDQHAHVAEDGEPHVGETQRAEDQNQDLHR